IMKVNFPCLNILGFQDGYFSDQEQIKIKAKIKELSPDLIFLGMGSPKQEELAIVLKNPKLTVYTCGAFISQTANYGVNYYPYLINKLHLRWLYRIFKEKGLVRRYLIEYPKSLWLIINHYYK